MVRPDQIPDAVVEAAYQRLYTMRAEDIQAAIAAALNAWPGVSVHNFDGYEYPEGIVLPLPTSPEDVATARRAIVTDTLIVDPPEGHRYGFPKAVPKEWEPHIIAWLIKEGYPPEEIQAAGDNFCIRCWRERRATMTEEEPESPQGCTPEALVEKVARAIADYELPVGPDWQNRWVDYKGTARAAIAVLRPALRADALEEAAKVADEFGDCAGFDVAEAIRALIETPKAPQGDK